MAFSGSGSRRAGDQQFFSPMGAGVGAVFGAPGAPAGTPPRPAVGGPVGAPAGTPPKLAVNDMYRRWFQMADAGVYPERHASFKRHHMAAGLEVADGCSGYPGQSPAPVRPSPPHPHLPPHPMGADGDGRLTGQDAVRFFERSGLPRDALARVWANSDSRRQGFLDFAAFVRALELVSLAQVLGRIAPCMHGASLWARNRYYCSRPLRRLCRRTCASLVQHPHPAWQPDSCHLCCLVGGPNGASTLLYTWLCPYCSPPVKSLWTRMSICSRWALSRHSCEAWTPIPPWQQPRPLQRQQQQPYAAAARGLRARAASITSPRDLPRRDSLLAAAAWRGQRRSARARAWVWWRALAPCTKAWMLGGQQTCGAACRKGLADRDPRAAMRGAACRKAGARLAVPARAPAAQQPAKMGGTPGAARPSQGGREAATGGEALSCQRGRACRLWLALQRRAQQGQQGLSQQIPDAAWSPPCWPSLRRGQRLAWQAG